jgi:hypothetical protein
MDYTTILNDIQSNTYNILRNTDTIVSEVTSSSAITATEVVQINSRLNILIILFIVFMVFEIVKIRGERR